jgi:two-component system phosphate regulon sensor histidine kinase PhoR
MTFDKGRSEPARPGWWQRLRPARAVLVSSLVVLALLAATSRLDPLHALAAGLVVLAVALWSAVSGAPPAPTGLGVEASADRSPVAAVDILRGVVDAFPQPVIVLDADGTVVALNSPARALAPALRLGEPVSLAIRIPAVLDVIRRAIASGEAQRAEFSERVPIDRWYEVHAAPVPAGAPSQRAGLLLTFHDLAPLRRVEEMRADFVANASHELRTPLAAISGFIDTLQGSARADEDARERFLGVMRDQARRMARLIDDLLSLSRVELNAHVPPETPVELTALVRQVANGLQMLARDRGIAVTIDAPEPVVARGDRDELVRVSENLIENALKYGGSGGRVEVAVMRAPLGDAFEARISVRDFGPGIAPEHLPRLTERFYRVDVGQSRAEGGTGLGLALVKHIVNRHRGRLLIESRPGEGATFTVVLPRVAAPA